MLIAIAIICVNTIMLINAVMMYSTTERVFSRYTFLESLGLDITMSSLFLLILSEKLFLNKKKRLTLKIDGAASTGIRMK